MATVGGVLLLSGMQAIPAAATTPGGSAVEQVNHIRPTGVVNLARLASGRSPATATARHLAVRPAPVRTGQTSRATAAPQVVGGASARRARW